MSAGTITAATGGSGASGASGVRTLLFGTWRGRFGIGVLALTIFVAIFGELLAPYDPTASSTDVLQSPSWSHILGTTENGSDVFSQLLVGTRVSVIVGFAAALISAVLGSIVGLAGGYFGGWTDRILDATGAGCRDSSGINDRISAGSETRLCD